jgi:hypothetical protein
MCWVTCNDDKELFKEVIKHQARIIFYFRTKSGKFVEMWRFLNQDDFDCFGNLKQIKF